MEEKIKKIYSDLIRTYYARYGTLLSQVPFSERFRNSQGCLYTLEGVIMTLEEEFPEICQSECSWKREWKDETFK